MPKVKDKERILKAKQKELVTYRGVPIRLSADFSKQITEPSENQAIWKSNNQGFKEATFIQTDAFYRESKQLYLIHRNKHREAAKLRRQRNMAQMKEQIKIPEKN